MKKYTKPVNNTEKEALENTKKMWKYLYNNPHITNKFDYFENNELDDDVINTCYLCAYSYQLSVEKEGCCYGMSSKQVCKYCPLKEMWTINKINNITKVTYCEQPSSPYNRWKEAYCKKERKKWAGEIVKLCEKRLKELEEERKESV